MSLLQLQLLDHVQAGPADGSPAPPALQQPRKLAVLAYLALADRPVPRTELATLLWGDTTDESARRSVRQVLHAIRNDCGFDPFIADRSTLQLNDKHIFCDVVQCYRALAFNPTPETVARYAGAFMPGFTIGGGSAFDDWCDAQRNRFDIALADAAWNAADQCSDARGALSLLEIAAQRRPLDQSILRRRMRCLQQIGEVGEALALYESYRVQLREQTGASPAKDTNELAHELLNAARDAVVVPAEVLNAAEPPVDDRHDNEARGLRALVLNAQARLRRHSGGLVGAAVLIVAMYVGFQVSSTSEATSRDIPVVMLHSMTISGVEPERREEIKELLSTLLGEDEQYALSHTNARASDAVLSLDLNVSDGVRGTATLSTPPGAVLATVPFMSPAQTDVAIAELARQIRRHIKLVLAPDEESRNEAAIEFRFDEVRTLQNAGAFAQAQTALDEIDEAIDNERLRAPSRRMLRSRWWEWNAWLSFGRDEDLAATASRLDTAIIVLEQNPDDPGVRQRLMDLNFNVYALRGNDDLEPLEHIELHATAIPNGDRSDETWIRLAQAQFHQGKFQEALGTGDLGRTTSPTLGVRRDLALIMFDAAFELDHRKRANYECRLIREQRSTEWQSIMCAALAMGWLDADYDPRDLLRELRFIENTEPSRTEYQITATEFIAAAVAHKKDSALADSILRTLPATPLDNGGKLLRAITLSELQRTSEADALLNELRDTSGGRRTLKGYARLLKP